MGMTSNQRKAARRKKARAMQAGEQASMATDNPAVSTVHRPEGMPEVLQKESAFAPEALSAENVAKYGPQGIGGGAGDSDWENKRAAFSKIQERWTEIKAVSERYPVPRAMLERIANDTFQTFVSANTSTRDKMIAAKLLLTMAAANQDTKGLPTQLEGSVNEGTRFDVRNIIDAIAREEGTAIVDTRAIQVEPGSAEDYAE